MYKLHLNYTKNNSFITLSKNEGEVVFWQTNVLNTNFKNSQKSSKVARSYACDLALKKLLKLKIKVLNLKYSGSLKWRRLMLKTLKKKKIKIYKLNFNFKTPFNGCKYRKKPR